MIDRYYSPPLHDNSMWKSKRSGTDSSDDEEVDLSQPLHPISYYIDDREEMIEQVFSSVKNQRLQRLLAPCLKDVPMEELKADCLIQLLGMSKKRILSIIEGADLRSSTDTESDSVSDKLGRADRSDKSIPNQIKNNNANNMTKRNKSRSTSYERPKDYKNIGIQGKLRSIKINLQERPKLKNDVPDKIKMPSDEECPLDISVSENDVKELMRSNKNGPITSNVTNRTTVSRRPESTTAAPLVNAVITTNTITTTATTTNTNTVSSGGSVDRKFKEKNDKRSQQRTSKNDANNENKSKKTDGNKEKNDINSAAADSVKKSSSSRFILKDDDNNRFATSEQVKSNKSIKRKENSKKLTPTDEVKRRKIVKTEQVDIENKIENKTNLNNDDDNNNNNTNNEEDDKGLLEIMELEIKAEALRALLENHDDDDLDVKAELLGLTDLTTECANVKIKNTIDDIHIDSNAKANKTAKDKTNAKTKVKKKSTKKNKEKRKSEQKNSAADDKKQKKKKKKRKDDNRPVASGAIKLKVSDVRNVKEPNVKIPGCQMIDSDENDPIEPIVDSESIENMNNISNNNNNDVNNDVTSLKRKIRSNIVESEQRQQRENNVDDSSWPQRWLERRNVRNVVTTSKICANIRKRMRIARMTRQAGVPSDNNGNTNRSNNNNNNNNSNNDNDNNSSSNVLNAVVDRNNQVDHLNLDITGSVREYYRLQSNEKKLDLSSTQQQN